ncbi:hypothetical protein QTP88_020488 [Uroleucon formosanum]
MNNINNKANQQIGKHKTTASSQPNNLIPHVSNSKYDDATSNKNSNGNFTIVTKQGKRNLSSSSQTSSISDQVNNKSQNIIKKKAKLFKSTNRFEILNQLDEPDLNSSSQQLPFEQNNISNEVFKPPPPIFVRGVVNYLDLCTALIELIGVDNFFCKTSANRLKIQTSNPESYRALIQFLKEQEAEIHTYQIKQDKPLRVVIRNLHPTTNVDTIKEELEVRLFEIRRVTNVLHKVTKILLPLFFVNLEPSIKSAEIFHLSSLLHTKIKVEEPYKSKTISQCTNCQEYGHTKTYCGYPSRCIRCGSNHKSSDCPNQRSDPPKCALCSGDHPASYKGCSIYKDLQPAKKPYTKSNLVPTNTRFNITTVRDSHPINDTHLIQPDPLSPTYAQATSGSFAISDADKAELFKLHPSEIFQPHPDIASPNNINSVEEFLNSPLSVAHPVKHFTPNEVKYATDKYLLKKSPGFDHITAEVARCLPKKAIIHLTH